ncbi:hypothetical protein AWH62_01220 [Maricaulis sp. W15]|uniref:hypothetical protein n=1 Tax=Maricaulis sp. W15 TaxID=1772333 RepID=UPI0009488E4C|nr:hypothetical protein [Maricaulis sp. W15]OLF81322.1 hypothetical protein AWH62_01220 [Maricaulis sp. W15]
MRLGLLMIGLVTGLLLPTDAFAQSVEREAGPLPRFFPHRETYLELDADRRSHFQLAYIVSSQDGIPPDEIEMWYELDGTRISFRIDAQGRIQHLPDLETLEAEPAVWINQEGGGMSLSMQFEARLGDGPAYAADDLDLALGQANHAVRQTAGVAALFAPNFKTLVFVFDGPAPRARAIHEDGSSTDLTVQENRVLVRPRDRGMRDLVRIEFGEAPIRVLIDS